jgi:hypothetical protein
MPASLTSSEHGNMKMHPVRERAFGDFQACDPEIRGGSRHWLMRAHNFSVEWIEWAAGAPALEFGSAFESMLIVEAGALDVDSGQGLAKPVRVPQRSVAIVPAGRHLMAAPDGARMALIASQRGDIGGRRVLNAEGCEPPDPRVLPAGTPYRRQKLADGVQVLPLEAIMASPDKPRLRMLQSQTLSLNLVEYDGPRDRADLSPHSHSSFEQGSLAIAGDFVHHLRVPWGSDAGLWREDEHLHAPSPSLLVVPVDMVHTTEGIGSGRHFLIDVFCPPRADFIEKGWVFNAGDYRRA